MKGFIAAAMLGFAAGYVAGVSERENTRLGVAHDDFKRTTSDAWGTSNPWSDVRQRAKLGVEDRPVGGPDNLEGEPVSTADLDQRDRNLGPLMMGPDSWILDEGTQQRIERLVRRREGEG